MIASSFPVNLSPSPMRETFPAALSSDLWTKLQISPDELARLRAAEEYVLDWTLSCHEDSKEYVHLLLRIFDIASHRRRPGKRKVKPSSVSKTLSEPDLSSVDQSHMSMEIDSTLLDIALHYSISKLYEIFQALCELQRNQNKTKRKINPSMASIFYPSGILIENCRPLLRILVSNALTDSFVERGAAYVIARICLEGRFLESQGQLLSSIESLLKCFVNWMTSRLQSSDAQNLSVLTPCMTLLLSDRLTRILFVDAGGIAYLTRHLKFGSTLSSSTPSNDISLQSLYEISYCLWMLSFDVDADERIRYRFHRTGTIASLVDLIIAAPREKVVRLSLAILRNLATCLSDGNIGYKRDPSIKKRVNATLFLQEMVGYGLVKAIDRTIERERNDIEVIQDVKILHQLLHDTCKHMTRWDAYESEVSSGYLKWSIIHTENFFCENSRRMEGTDGSFGIVKDLMVLTTHYDEEIASIACFDLGEFVRNYPNGKLIAKRLGARDMVLKLINHSNPDLRHHALQCVSKMLVQKCYR